MILTPIKMYEWIKTNGFPIATNLQITRNFFWWEVLQNQTVSPGLCELENLAKIVEFLQLYREKYFGGNPVIITSGWRELLYNRKIGSSDGSFHPRGKAIDFYVPRLSIDSVYEAMDKNHIGGVGDGRKRGFCHIDLGPAGRRWDY